MFLALHLLYFFTNPINGKVVKPFTAAGICKHTWLEKPAAKVDKALEQIADSNNTSLLCGNYGEAGAINYYSAHKNIAAVALSGDCYKQFLEEKKLQKNSVLVKVFDNPIPQ